MEQPEVTSEAAVNEAAAAEIAASKPEVGVPEQVAESTVVAPASAQKTDPQKTAPTGQAAFDAQKSYEELQKQLAETRKWGTQVSQERAEMRRKIEAYEKQQAEMAKRLAEMSEEPFNLEQFNKEFVSKGFKAFDPYIEKKLSAVQQAYEARLEQMASEVEMSKTNFAIMQRKSDSKNFPDFADLEAKMAEIYQSPTCPIDKTLPLDQKLDALYQLAKTQSSTEAIKAAKQVGYEKAQAELAKEARSAVATGGKGISANPVDPNTMPLDQLEKWISQTYGVVDR